MPAKVEEGLRKAGEKKGYKGKRLEEFIYSIMTKEQEKGSIAPWRTIKHPHMMKMKE